jgi:hypothetical protein
MERICWKCKISKPLRIVFVLLTLITCSAYSIQPFSYAWQIKLTGDTATVAKWKANNDSVLNWSTRVCDTLKPASIPRWNMFRNHDSTFRWMNIDTIKGPVRLDSIKGPLFADTAKLNRLTVGKIDSVYSAGGIKTDGNVYCDSIVASKVGLITFDSGTVPCTLSIASGTLLGGGYTVDTVGTLSYSKIGNFVIYKIDDMTFTLVDGAFYTTNFPAIVTPPETPSRYFRVNIPGGQFSKKNNWKFWNANNWFYFQDVNSGSGDTTQITQIDGNYFIYR